MRPEVISEAIKGIDDEYKLEALELHDRVTVSDELNMGTHKTSKKVIGIGIAVGLIAALGVTAYATDLFGIKQHDPEPEETFEVEYTIENEDGSFSIEKINYDNIKKCISFDGPDACDKVRFKASYLPEGCVCTFPEEMDMTGWNDYNLQVEDANGYVINICLYYSAEFGTDGSMIFEEEVTDTEEATIGDYTALKMAGYTEYLSAENDGESEELIKDDNCYIILENPDGCIFVISGQDMDELVKIAEGLEVEKTGETIEFDPTAEHNIYICNGVG